MMWLKQFQVRAAFSVFIVGLVGLCGAGNKELSCSKLPTKLTFSQNDTLWTYQPSQASLSLEFHDYLFFSQDWCEIRDDSYYYPYFKIDLISTSKPRHSGYDSGLQSREAVRERCRRLRKGSFIQASAVLHVNKTRHTFHYVQGLYYMRLSACKIVKKGHQDGASGGLEEVEQCQDDLICSDSQILEAEVPKNEDVCEYDFPNNVSAEILETSSRFARYYSSSASSVSAGNSKTTSGTPPGGVAGNNETAGMFCDIALRAIIPLCTAHQSYDTVTVIPVEVDPEHGCNFGDFHDQMELAKNNHKNNQTTAASNSLATLQPCSPADLCNTSEAYGVLEHKIPRISRNATYCLFFRLNNPHCRGDAGCVFYTQTLTCDLLRPASTFGLVGLVTQPVFIGVVSATLFCSLALLTWTIIQCSKKSPGTPLITSNGSNTASNTVKKPPPRSLTEDDLEHISRLPSQEIVLVYFPDTARFKELNRKLRNWLVTLDVNDVKDIYDEKCSEDVLKDPETWVRNALGGPEKRIILVCSKLAYECLVCVKRGIASPKFVETDPHFGLLTRTIQYLDREMRGNYRNLICVRYEDLKICSRNYSSEAFNIVPGTEYVLPQHLEDVYRWIHPRDPKPECWNEKRPEVEDLFDSIRQYRHHDENIFTVQFNEAIENAEAELRAPLTGVSNIVNVPNPENQSPFTKRRLLITQNL